MTLIDEYKNHTENKLIEYFDEYRKDSSYASKVWDSMQYTTMLPGKRIRAVLCLEICRLLSKDYFELLPGACALELMHSYSLIHDDLPCMDNDDIRRGKPSNHKVYGEAIAVLAGDALISFGAQILIDKLKFADDRKIKIVNKYLQTAGALGIVAGQVADIEAEGEKISIENLQFIHKYKTGSLFECSVELPLIAFDIKGELREKLLQFATNFGLLFQVYDDIIDYTLSSEELGKTAGKDKIENKSTYVSILGMSEAKNIFTGLLLNNRDILSTLDFKSEVFDSLFEFLNKRIT